MEGRGKGTKREGKRRTSEGEEPAPKYFGLDRP